MNWPLLINSLLVSSLAALLATLFGLVAALCLAGLTTNARRMLLVSAVMTAALPPFLVTNCWLHFLGLAGVWRGWLPFDILSPAGAIWVLSLLTWPIPLLAVWGAWQRLEPSQLECDPAVTGWTLIRGLLLPLARTTLAQAAVLTFVLALNNFAVPAILQVKVFPAEMWLRFNTNFDTAGALRLSWPLVLGPLILLAWLVRSELPWPRLEGTVPHRLFRNQLGAAWFWSCAIVTVALCFVSLGLPLLQLVSVKRTWTELPGTLAAGQAALWSSFWFATAAATIDPRSRPFRRGADSGSESAPSDGRFARETLSAMCRDRWPFSGGCSGCRSLFRVCSGHRADRAPESPLVPRSFIKAQGLSSWPL